jgi:hypothetical protein
VVFPWTRVEKENSLERCNWKDPRVGRGPISTGFETPWVQIVLIDFVLALDFPHPMPISLIMECHCLDVFIAVKCLKCHVSCCSFLDLLLDLESNLSISLAAFAGCVGVRRERTKKVRPKAKANPYR